MSKLIPQMAKLIPQKLIPQQLTPHQAQLAGFYRPSEVPAEPPIRQYIVRSKIVIAALFGGFGLWAAFAPLTSAAVAPGVVKVDSYRKTVQHLEGGIVSEILVHEGDAVVQGQPLVRLTMPTPKPISMPLADRSVRLRPRRLPSRSNFRASRNSSPMSEASSKRVMQRSRRSLSLSEPCSK